MLTFRNKRPRQRTKIHRCIKWINKWKNVESYNKKMNGNIKKRLSQSKKNLEKLKDPKWENVYKIKYVNGSSNAGQYRLNFLIFYNNFTILYVITLDRNCRYFFKEIFLTISFPETLLVNFQNTQRKMRAVHLPFLRPKIQLR